MINEEKSGFFRWDCKYISTIGICIAIEWNDGVEIPASYANGPNRRYYNRVINYCRGEVNSEQWYQ